MLTEILLVLILLLLIVVLYFLLKGREVEPKAIESVFFRVWQESGINEKLGAVEGHVKEIKETYKEWEQMLRAPTLRGEFGEILLETLLSDHLPPDMYGIRKKVLEGKTPDAYIKSTVGIICIDSKFPLDNYRKMVEAEDEKTRGEYQKSFLRDVKNHLKKVAEDYVCPEKGSADFALVFIPSEAVYWFLVHEAYEDLREFARKGVQVVSPLTLAHKLELIKAGVFAKRLSEKTLELKNTLAELERQFQKVDDLWSTFYSTHFKNMIKKADEVDTAYKKLREKFRKVADFAETE